jgi:hypothetical protein
MEISHKCNSLWFDIGAVFLIYTNNLLKITDKSAKVVFFTDDTSIMVINSDQGGLVMNKKHLFTND